MHVAHQGEISDLEKGGGGDFLFSISANWIRSAFDLQYWHKQQTSISLGNQKSTYKMPTP